MINIAANTTKLFSFLLHTSISKFYSGTRCRAGRLCKHEKLLKIYRIIRSIYKCMYFRNTNNKVSENHQKRNDSLILS